MIKKSGVESSGFFYATKTGYLLYPMQLLFRSIGFAEIMKHGSIQRNWVTPFYVNLPAPNSSDIKPATLGIRHTKQAQ